MLWSAIIFGLFGLIVGSFLNVLILRRGIKTLLGRSGCLSCGAELEAMDLVPILSWLALRGRCRRCGSRISIQYPLVEAATALLFAAIGAAPIALYLQILALPSAALLIAIAAYDIKHTIIPDSWVYLFALFSLAFSLAHLYAIGAISGWPGLLLAGPATALPFVALWFFSGGRWMGLGDGKLAVGVGWLSGPLFAFFAIALSFLIGAAVSVFILLPLSSPGFWNMLRRFTPISVSQKLKRGFTMESEVAFGPFLAAGCIVVWLLILYGIGSGALLGALSP